MIISSLWSTLSPVSWSCFITYGISYILSSRYLYLHLDGENRKSCYKQFFWTGLAEVCLVVFSYWFAVLSPTVSRQCSSDWITLIRAARSCATISPQTLNMFVCLFVCFSMYEWSLETDWVAGGLHSTYPGLVNSEPVNKKSIYLSTCTLSYCACMPHLTIGFSSVWPEMFPIGIVRWISQHNGVKGTTNFLTGRSKLGVNWMKVNQG